MTDAPKPTDEKNPSGAVSPEPTGGKPATPPVEAIKPTEPTPGAEVKPGATPVPGATGQVPISALHEERTKRQGLEKENEQLREAVQVKAYEQQNYQAQPAAPVQPQEPQQTTEQVNQMWEDNPRQAVRAEIYQAMQWRDSIDSGISRQSAMLQNKFTDYNDHRQNAETYVRSLPMEQRANPNVMETAYFIVRGQNQDKALEKQKNELYAQYQQGGTPAQVATPAAGAYSAPPATPGVQLTVEQLSAASMMGMSPEDYASSIVVK